MFDTFRSTQKGSKDDLLEQIVELEKKKLLLQQQNGNTDVNELKLRLQKLETEVNQLERPVGSSSTGSNMYSNFFSNSKQNAQLTKEALDNLLSESFSDSEDNGEEDEFRFSSSSTSRSTSGRSIHNKRFSKDILKQHSLHPLSNRLNYNKIIQQPPPQPAPGTIKPTQPLRNALSNRYTPPRTNIRTISSSHSSHVHHHHNNDEGDSFTTLPNLPPFDEVVAKEGFKTESTDLYGADSELYGGMRTSIVVEDFDLDYLNQTEALSPSQQISLQQQHQNLLEFCIIEADWHELVRAKQTASTPVAHQYPPSSSYSSSTQNFLTCLIPSKLQWRYPSVINEQTNNTTTIQEQNFFFPSGVKIELVSKSVMDIKTRKYNFKRHIVPFSDRKGLPLYACCLTIIQSYSIDEISKIHEDIPIQLYRLLRGKQAVKIIQKAFRRYAHYKKMKMWQTIDIGDIKKLQLENQQRQFGKNSSETGLGSLKDGNSTHEGGRGSITSGSNTPAVGGGGGSQKPGFFSRLFRRSQDPSMMTKGGREGSLSGRDSEDDPAFFNSSRHGSSSTHGMSSTASNATTTVNSSKEKDPHNNNNNNMMTPPPTSGRSSLFGLRQSQSVDPNSSKPPTKTNSKEKSISLSFSGSKNSKLSEGLSEPPSPFDGVASTGDSPVVRFNAARIPKNNNSKEECTEAGEENVADIILQSIDPKKEEEIDYLKEINDKLIVGQKAYCIISSIPEYTFIFKVI
jgi:hypothetical protein